MRTEAGKMPESLTFPIKNGLGVSNDRFGFKIKLSAKSAAKPEGAPARRKKILRDISGGVPGRAGCGAPLPRAKKKARDSSRALWAATTYSPAL